MKKVTTFTEIEKNLEMSFTMLIPKVNKQAGSDFDLDKARKHGQKLMIDILKAFAPRIIASLIRRMNACQNLLISHFNDIEYNDGRHICWYRKDGTSGNFNVPSFEAMQNCVKALENSCFKEFVTKKSWIDQVLKALLNDDEQDHSSVGEYRYSQLVSILCELQACPQEYMPK